MKLENAQKAADLIRKWDLLDKQLNTIKRLYASSKEGLTVYIGIHSQMNYSEFISDSHEDVQALLALQISLIEERLENTKKELESL